jgi:hypothetical protein
MTVARLAAVALLAVTLLPFPAAAHLFHRTYEPPENQMTRDTRLLQLVLDDPAERFDLARQVWEGRTRVRVKPGGFRKWLVRPSEPGMVFKADYQLNRWSGSLRTEAARIDQRHGSTLVERVESGLGARNREQVKSALRAMYLVLLRELLESVWAHLEDAETVERLYPFVLRYYAVNLQGHLNMRQPAAAAGVEATLAAISRALGDSETGAPPAPEVFDRQRTRLLRVLGEAVGRS